MRVHIHFFCIFIFINEIFYARDLSKIYNTFTINVVLKCYLKVFFHKNLIIEFLLLQLENPKEITNEVEDQSNLKQTHIN